MRKRPPSTGLSILLVDDDKNALELYSELLSQRLSHKITTSQYPTQAIGLARERLFDIVIIDVTIDYHGSPFGGLDLYKQLLPRYGNSSLLAYSQYITDDLLKRYHYAFNFIEKTTDVISFVEKVRARVHELREEQTCFVAMPFDGAYNRIFQAIKSSIEAARYRCVRIDKQTFTSSIVAKIFNEIHRSKLVIFVATDRNPNAFYECGYAVALNKEVVTVTDSYDNLPFDIRDRSSIAYNDTLQDLQAVLTRRLLKLTADE